jgi:crotonobetainyl-CoA hydratase
MSDNGSAGDKVLVDRAGAVGVITINRPDVRNVIDGDVAAAIEAALDSFDVPGSGISAVVLTGAGDRAFSGGMDLKAFAKYGPRGAYFTEKGGFAGIARRQFQKPFVCAVNGAAVGGGMEIALAADCVVASENAIFGLPETKIGLVAAGGGAIRLGRRVPRALALEMAMTGDSIKADRAFAIGLINEVTTVGGALAGAVTLAERIAAASPIAVKVTRQLMLDSLECSEEEAWAKTTDGVRVVLRSEDSKEGPRAFIEKRAPVWAAL